MGVSHLVTEGESRVSDTIFRSQKGRHVLDEPGILALRSPLAFTASKREVVLGNWESSVWRYHGKLPGWYAHSILVDTRVSLLN